MVECYHYFVLIFFPARPPFVCYHRVNKLKWILTLPLCSSSYAAKFCLHNCVWNMTALFWSPFSNHMQQKWAIPKDSNNVRTWRYVVQCCAHRRKRTHSRPRSQFCLTLVPEFHYTSFDLLWEKTEEMKPSLSWGGSDLKKETWHGRIGKARQVKKKIRKQCISYEKAEWHKTGESLNHFCPREMN